MQTLIKIDWLNQSFYLKELPDQAKPRLVFNVHYRGLIFTGNNIMFLLPDDRTANVSVTATDAKGFAAPIESLAYSSSDESIIAIDQTGIITPVGIGTATINVTADAQIGEGVTTLAGMLEVQVIAGQAVSLGLSATINPAEPIA